MARFSTSLPSALSLLLLTACAPAAKTPAQAPAQAPEPIVSAPQPPTPPPPAAAPARPPVPDPVVLDGPMLKPAGSGYKLDPKGLAAVRQAAEAERAYGPGLAVIVTGYTSATGSRSKNMALSHYRAEAVAKALIQAGVPSGQITVRGLGPDNPVADNATHAGRLRNQRVEITFAAQ